MTCAEDLARLGIRILRTEGAEVVVRGIPDRLSPSRVSSARGGRIQRYWMAWVDGLVIKTEAGR